MKKVAIISSCSFSGPGPRIGMQFIAQILARAGFLVHYLSQPSSVFDFLSASRRPRFRRAWGGGGQCQEVEKNLWEHFVRAPFPVNKKFWFLPRQYDWYGRFLPRSLKKIPFDLCLHDVSSCLPLLEHLSFRKLILRVNDHPEGFSYATPRIVIKRLVRNIASGRYQQTWPVSAPLLEYARNLHPGGIHVLISNGVDSRRFFEGAAAAAPPDKKAVFVGALDRWVDLPLLAAAARLLPDWSIDLYGPHPGSFQACADNIRWRGPIAYQDVPGVLGSYQVGLIPFRQNEPLVAMMERPLKFYEYLAAGLGIASTDAGSLKTGMQGWARFGSTPGEFAEAVIQAAADSRQNSQQRRAFLEAFSWPRIGELVLDSVERSLAA